MNLLLSSSDTLNLIMKRSYVENFVISIFGYKFYNKKGFFFYLVPFLLFERTIVSKNELKRETASIFILQS